MGYDLRRINDEAYFRWGFFEWTPLLRLALQNGWEPEGTLRPGLGPDYVIEPPDWGGGYCSNDFQRVTDSDAANLAAALERSLADIPDHEAAAHLKITIPITGEIAVTGWKPEARPSVFEQFAGATKEYVRKFIAFCRGGGFEIG